MENVPDAEERPARCLDQGAPLVPAGGVGREAASWEQSPRPSAGRPERSARDPQTPEQPTRHETNEGNGASGERNAKWPVVVSIDGDGHERRWGPLSLTAAWRAGRFWEGGNGAVKVFIEKGDERKEVDVEKRNVRGRESFWLLDKNQQLQETQE